MPDEFNFDEDALTEYWQENISRFNGTFPLNEFLKWCWEWEEACSTVRRAIERLKGE